MNTNNQPIDNSVKQGIINAGVGILTNDADSLEEGANIILGDHVPDNNVRNGAVKVAAGYVTNNANSIVDGSNAIIGNHVPDNNIRQGAVRAAAGFVTNDTDSLIDGINTLTGNEQSDNHVRNGVIEATAGVVTRNANAVINGLNTVLGDEQVKNENDINHLIKKEDIFDDSICPEFPKNLNLGLIVCDGLETKYIEKLNSFRRLSYGNVKLVLHTHGIKCDCPLLPLRIHYSQIVSIKKEIVNVDYHSAAKKALNSGVTKAVLGGVLHDYGAVVSGVQQTMEEGVDIGGTIEQFLESGDYVDLVFWDIKTKSKVRLLFKSINPNDKAVDEFIKRYYEEVNKNERYHRKAFFAESTPGCLIMCCILGAIFNLFIIVPILSTRIDIGSSSEKPVVRQNNNVKKTVVNPASEVVPELPAESEESETMTGDWLSSDSKCTIKKSGTTLTVSGKSAAGASVEITGAGVDDCETVSVSFDKKTPISVGCSVSGRKLKLSSDAGFIKKMRNSNSMVVTIPNDTDDGKSIKYSLMGFSKACDWAK